MNKTSLNTYLKLMVVSLLLHIIYEFVFLYMKQNILIFYNIISIIVFSLGIFFLKKNDKYAVLACFLEVDIFCMLTTIELGWSYGFQNWLIVSCILALSIPFKNRVEFYLIAFMNGVTYTALYIIVELNILNNSLNMIDIFFSITNVMGLFCIIFLAESVFRWSTAVETFFLQREIEEMKNIVEEDELTKLLTRRKMNEILESKKCELHKVGEEFFIAFADIDDFKYINDNYGHIVGDEILTLVSKILKNELRKDDMVARWGGEEFLILLTNGRNTTGGLNNDFAFSVLNRLREKIQNTKMNYEGDDISVTMTFGGVSSLYFNSIEDMIKIADEKMYEGKNSGKNKVVI